MISSSQRPLPENTQHSQQTSMLPVGFEPPTPGSERPQTYAQDRAATVFLKSRYLVSHSCSPSPHLPPSCSPEFVVVFTRAQLQRHESTSHLSLCSLVNSTEFFTIYFQFSLVVSAGHVLRAQRCTYFSVTLMHVTCSSIPTTLELIILVISISVDDLTCEHSCYAICRPPSWIHSKILYH